MKISPCAILLVSISAGVAGGESKALDDLLAGRFDWVASEPLLQPVARDGDQYHALKDPTIVRANGRWHVFCTIRGKKRSHQIEYLSFADWSSVGNARRETLRLTDGYIAAPEVFYFKPQKKWYLIYQIVDQTLTPSLQPAYSTTDDIGNPSSWSKPKLMLDDPSQGVKSWIDFWVISDGRRAHLFFTTLNGEMWRSDAPLNKFPNGWDKPKVVLKDDIYEASHTYRLKGLNKYMTLVEARAPAGKRYYKAYLADNLEGAWTPLAATLEKAFAAPANVRFAGQRWSDSFSHGELLRDGSDETLTADPNNLVLLFQGVSAAEMEGKQYGQIPWRLGLLRLAAK